MHMSTQISRQTTLNLVYKILLTKKLFNLHQKHLFGFIHASN